MSVSEECNIGSRYKAVRRHLDNLGYRHALPLDALPLIEKLLADLIQTTETLKHFKGIAQDNIEACSELQLTVDPYKCDNACLVEECNQLHLQLTEAKEVHQSQIKELNRQIYKLECECSDLQLASSHNLQKIKELETESSKKSKRILELQGKCLKPIINNVALASKKRSCYPLRRPVLESEALPQTRSTSSLPTATTVEPKTIDLLNMADIKLNNLNREVVKLKGELSIETDTTHILKNQLAIKEREIIRLRKMLEGGRPYIAVSKDCVCNKRNKNSLSLHSESTEIKVLQEAKLELEQQFKEAINKQHDAMTQAMKLAERNEQLEKELRDIDHIALAVEADCNSTVKKNNKRVCILQDKLQTVMTQLRVLENDLITERRELQELRADFEACKLTKRNIQRTLETTLNEKKQMTDKINQLTVIEKSLNDEIDRITKENECQKQDIIQLQYINKTLKEQLHTWQVNDEINFLTMEDRSRKHVECQGRQPHVQNCPGYVSSGSMHEKCCGCIENVDTKVSEQIKPEKTPSNISEVIYRLERERDTARADFKRILQERDALRERIKLAMDTHLLEQKRLKDDLAEMEGRLKTVDRERQDSLLMQGSGRAIINGLEDQLSDMRDEVKRTKQELAAQRTQYFQLRALQDQTDEALGDVQGQLNQSEAELNKARERNRSMEQQQMRMDNRVEDLQEEISTMQKDMAHLDQEKDHLLGMLDEKTEKIAVLERELMLKKDERIGMEQQLQDLRHKNEICVDQSAQQEQQLRTVQLELETVQRQLELSNANRETALLENRRLQDDVSAATFEIRNLQRDCESFRVECTELKKQLQTYVSEVRRAEDLLAEKEGERTEMLNHFRSLSLEATVLENNNHSLESEAAEAKVALRSATERLDDLEHRLADKEGLVRGYETQIGELTQNVASMEVQLRHHSDERQRLESDLHTVRNLCIELDTQKDSLVRQVDEKESMKAEYEAQLQRLEMELTIMQEKMEKDHASTLRLESLLTQARDESIIGQTHNQELQKDIAKQKQKITNLQNQLSNQSTELRQYQNQVAEYSTQICDLRRQLTNEKFNRAKREEDSRRSLNSTPDSFNVDLNVVI